MIVLDADKWWCGQPVRRGDRTKLAVLITAQAHVKVPIHKVPLGSAIQGEDEIFRQAVGGLKGLKAPGPNTPNLRLACRSRFPRSGRLQSPAHRPRPSATARANRSSTLLRSWTKPRAGPDPQRSAGDSFRAITGSPPRSDWFGPRSFRSPAGTIPAHVPAQIWF